MFPENPGVKFALVFVDLLTMQVLCYLWLSVRAESQPVQGAELILYAQETGAIKEVHSAQVSVQFRVYLCLCACESRGLELNKIGLQTCVITSPILMHVVSKLLAVICSRVHPILVSQTGKMVTCSSIAIYSKMAL
jgi:hypothetical protein